MKEKTSQDINKQQPPSQVEVRVENSPLLLNDDGTTGNPDVNSEVGILPDANETSTAEIGNEDEKKDLWMDYDDFFHCFR